MDVVVNNSEIGAEALMKTFKYKTLDHEAENTP